MLLNIVIRKTGRVVSLGETESLPAASLAYLIQYGANQSGNDAHASIVRKNWTGTEAEFVAAVDKEVDDWVARVRAGTVAIRSVAVDPAVAKIRDAAKAAGVNVDDIDPDQLVVMFSKLTKKPAKAA